MKRLFAGLVGLTMLTISGYVYAWLADEPIRVIHQHVACPTAKEARIKDVQVKGFQVLSTHQWSKGLVVLYSADCPARDGKAGMQRVFGHQVVERNGVTWQVSSADSYGIGHHSNQPRSQRLIEYGITSFGNPANQAFPHTAWPRSVNQSELYTIVYGQVLTPKVAAVEATFNNGQVLREQSVEGAFALIAPGATGVCELRILGPDHQILRKEELANPDSFPLPKRLINNSSSAQKCLPASHML